MKLSSLIGRRSFALLGPGFAAGRGGRTLLLDGLREVRDRPDLIHAAFEDRGDDARRLRGEVRPITLEIDLAPPALSLALEAPGYRQAIEEIRAAIAAGDVYQVCYTVRAITDGPLDGARLFAAMCRHGLPRFAAWVRLPDGSEFVSASPELLFEVDGERVRAEPMKGTARPDQGGALAASEKDRCELAMITDLLRNDLAQVCQPRSVRVACERRVIQLPYALQTVSDVVGRLPRGATALDLLAALHPGGSVTGAPKRAALRMIRRLEAGPRGAYCGALGLVDGDRARFSLLIRTAQRRRDRWVYGVGGGIVYDSDAQAELEEIETKLGALGGDGLKKHGFLHGHEGRGAGPPPARQRW